VAQPGRIGFWLRRGGRAKSDAGVSGRGVLRRFLPARAPVHASISHHRSARRPRRPKRPADGAAGRQTRNGGRPWIKQISTVWIYRGPDLRPSFNPPPGTLNHRNVVSIPIQGRDESSIQIDFSIEAHVDAAAAPPKLHCRRHRRARRFQYGYDTCRLSFPTDCLPYNNDNGTISLPKPPPPSLQMDLTQGVHRCRCCRRQWSGLIPRRQFVTPARFMEVLNPARPNPFLTRTVFLSCFGSRIAGSRIPA